MKGTNWLIYGVAASACLTGIGCSDDAVDVMGAGATFPAPLYKRWFLEYYHQHPDVRVNYQAIGSGAGIRQFSGDLVDFGASDAAMSPKEIERATKENPGHKGVLMLPLTAGSVAICYNVAGAPHDLKMSKDVYPSIFLGKITFWDDDAIKNENPGAQLPHEPITVVRRAEGSGTTYCFTGHLSAVSEEWKKGPGQGKSVQWPVGIGGKGNAGVAALIQQTPGAIGYLETGYAELLHLPTVQVRNQAGNYVLPTLETGQAALLEQMKDNERKGKPALPDNLVDWLSNPPGKDSYPIVTYTWALCWKDYGEARTKQAHALKDVLRYCLTDGQQLSSKLGYIPLPEEVTKRVLAAVDTIKP